MQSIMYHLKCHSFSNTIIMLFLGDGLKKVVQGIHQHCHYVIFLSNMKPDYKKSQTLVERKTGRELLPELDQLCVLHSCALLCVQIIVTSNNQVKASRELWGQNARKKGFITGTSKQC